MRDKNPSLNMKLSKFFTVTDEQLNNLRSRAFEVIRELGLPVPTSIVFRNNKSVNLRRMGTCIKDNNSGSYRISIPRYRKIFVEDEKGNYLNHITGKSVRLDGSEHRNFEEIRETLAHEIAHLEHWNHSIQHKSFLREIERKLKAE